MEGGSDWMDGRLDAWMDGLIDGWLEGSRDGWMEGRTNRWSVMKNHRANFIVLSQLLMKCFRHLGSLTQYQM